MLLNPFLNLTHALHLRIDAVFGLAVEECLTVGGNFQAASSTGTIVTGASEPNSCQISVAIQTATGR